MQTMYLMQLLWQINGLDVHNVGLWCKAKHLNLSVTGSPAALLLCSLLLSMINEIHKPLLPFLIDLWTSWYNNLVFHCTFIFLTLIFVMRELLDWPLGAEWPDLIGNLSIMLSTGESLQLTDFLI